MKFNTVIAVAFVLLSPAFKGRITPGQNEFPGVVIEQNGQRINLSSAYTELTLKKSAFSLEFEVFPYQSGSDQWYAVQVAATADSGNLKYFREGDITGENPFFEPGSGMAPAENNIYDCMFIGESGHHFIYYENDSDRRAEIIMKKPNGKIRLKWTIPVFCIQKTETPIENTTLDHFFIMVFIDENLNKKIEKGEYNLVKINLI